MMGGTTAPTTNNNAPTPQPMHLSMRFTYLRAEPRVGGGAVGKDEVDRLEQDGVVGVGLVDGLRHLVLGWGVWGFRVWGRG